jgi:hypothetical protein
VDLGSQLELLDKLLLTSVKTEFPDQLSDSEKASVNAYLVLSHACVEEYVENVFLRHLDRLINLCCMPLVPRELAELCIAVGLHLPESMRANATYKTRTLEGIALAWRRAYQTVNVRQNNGIKASNIMKLAEGIGLNWNDCESTLLTSLADLDTLGAKRGEAGHVSPFSPYAVAVTEQAYPDHAREWVVGGLKATLAIESYLSRRLRTQMQTFAAADTDVSD